MSAALVASSSSAKNSEEETEVQSSEHLDEVTETSQANNIPSRNNGFGIAKTEGGRDRNPRILASYHSGSEAVNDYGDYATNGVASFPGNASQATQSVSHNFMDSESLKLSAFESDSKPSATSSDTLEKPLDQNLSSSSPIPPGLLAILKEVAETGNCSWLPWEETEEDNNIRRPYACSPSPAPLASVMHSHASLPFHRRTQHTHSIGKRHHLYHGSMGSSKRARSSSSGTGIGSSPKSHNKQALQHRHYYPGGGSTTTTATTVAAGASRKKYHNGLHPRPSSGRRFADAGSSARSKHPLFLIRTTSSTSNTSSIFSPGSVGSGRTSGSEPEESSQYECDSEGTSATSNSELSFGEARSQTELRKRRGLPGSSNSSLNQQTRATLAQSPEAGSPPPPKFKSLKAAVYTGMNLVLDHFYEHRGGYKPRWAEKEKKSAATTASTLDRAHTTASDLLEKPDRTTFNEHGSENDVILSARESIEKEGFAVKGSGNSSVNENPYADISQDYIYRERKQLLLNLLGTSTKSEGGSSEKSSGRSSSPDSSDGPPFTIQRIAEVLIAPERYYTQTHKLCNCLEKLLLVRSSVAAFGGSIGGATSQTRLEDAELAALANEKSRLQTEVRQNRRRLRRKSGSPLLEDTAPATDGQEAFVGAKIGGNPENAESLAVSMEDIEDRRRTGNGSDSDGEEPNLRGACSQEVSQEMLEAAARAQLRTKFDHVGIDPHSPLLNNLDVRAIAENRGMTNSPPPPSLGITASPCIALTGGHSGLLRHHPGSPTSPDRSHSPMVRAPSPILFNSSTNGNEGSSSPTMPLMHPNQSNMQLLQLHHAVAMAGVSPFDLFHSSSVGGRTSSAVPGNHGVTVRDMDIESRSSASSDLDSESDVSFDDSASDRSDGSDSGQHNEHLTAARAMALNRLQQQQRRVLTSLHQQHGERPPSDNEYQSGDSIDSTRAEDSGGSDSSSSDLAD